MAQETYLVLARKWRPQRFEEVVGQDHITRPLQNSIRSGRIAHAYLFIGTRGVGKTTTARLLAKALNCLSSSAPTAEPCGTCENCRTIAAGNNIDVMEIDGASNNKVEDVREIREHVGMVPSSSRYKIYIIDEVHQLSASAFNALLKTLEEPPSHAVFILATTEAHKVPATIVSRCQRYDFRRVGLDAVKTMLRRILDAEGVRCSEEALHAIARAADGSIRDAESILEQVISYSGNEITFHDVFEVLGLVDWQTFHDLCDAILAKDIKKELAIVEEVVARGKDLNQFLQDVLQYFRNLLVCKTVADPAAFLALPEEEISAMQARAEKFKLTDLIRLIEQFADLLRDFHSQLGQRILLETTLIRISKVAVEVSIDTVLEKLMELGAGGVTSATPGASPPNPRRAATTGLNTSVAAAEEKTEPNGAGEDKDRGTGDSARVTVNQDNLREVWAAVTHRVAKENLSLAVALGHGQPDRVREQTLVLRFASYHDRSYELADRPSSHELVDRILQRLTANVTCYECTRMTEESGGDSAFSSQPTRQKSPRSFPSTKVPQDLVQKAMENPHVVSVLDIFKGEIVAVHRHGVSPDADGS
ncbi:MAG TPA: DNA polymerase III subunit gamma/tau [Candidatus Hydrogenedentes bacterium]|nr:DNA polymerase III subunit gamma/tau [Candidatus Hydrogenedentota bacterium]HOL77660.1 DNA polymerase III subunit gamma/tau [Candidatus Hydrogenedentota bacterium]HPO86710.1 DNA polymerase III subunit gamma/tau [Candidatus Hydrogenedentota bacterium]